MSLVNKLLLAALQSRTAASLIGATPEARGSFKGSHALLWKELEDFYSLDQAADSADTEIIKARLLASCVDSKAQRLASQLFDEVLAEPISLANVERYVLDTANRHKRMEIAAAIVSNKEDEEVDALVTSWQATRAQGAVEAPEESLDDILNPQTIQASLLPLLMPCLAARLTGGIPKGTCIIVFGRPNAGKSGLALTLAAGAACRGHKVLYLVNEERSSALKRRAVHCLTALTPQEVAADYQQATDMAEELGFYNIVFREISPGTPDELRALVEKHEPELVIVDQMRNLAVPKVGNNTERLDAAARAVRGLSNKYNVATIGIMQATAEAEGKLILDMSDVDGSKTGIPGAGDVILGIGVNPAYYQAGLRQLSICKNKVGGSEHEQVNWPVTFNAAISRYSTKDG